MAQLAVCMAKPRHSLLLCFTACKHGSAPCTRTQLDDCGWFAEYLDGAGNEMYEVHLPAGVEGMTYLEAVQHLYDQYRVVLLGVRLDMEELSDAQRWAGLPCVHARSVAFPCVPVCPCALCGTPARALHVALGRYNVHLAPFHMHMEPGVMMGYILSQNEWLAETGAVRDVGQLVYGACWCLIWCHCLRPAAAAQHAAPGTPLRDVAA